MDILTLLVFGLATWRVSRILVTERGPFDVFARLRKYAGIEYDPNGEMTIIPDGFLPGVLSCVWCASIWVGFFWVVFLALFPTIALYCGAGFAVSSLAIGVDRLIE